MYRHLEAAWKRPAKSSFGDVSIQDLMRARVVAWRRQPSINRVDKPTRLDRAHRLGYKAKPGFVMVRVKVRRGGAHKLRPILGHRQKRMGVTKYTPSKSLKLIAEQRASRKFINLEVLNSYWVWQDGQSKWFEIIMLDPQSPHVKADRDVNWVCRS